MLVISLIVFRKYHIDDNRVQYGITVLLIEANDVEWLILSITLLDK